MKLGFERIKTLAELTQRLTVILGQLISRITTLEDTTSTDIPDRSITSIKLAEDIDFVNMPTVEGDPIVETGSNANGTWTKFPDGTMICYGEVEVTTITSNVWATTIWTLPSAFIDTNYKVFTSLAEIITNLLTVTAGRVSTTTIASASVAIGTNTDLTHTVHIMAIGRWK